jgi:hypothetical protein
MKAVSEVPDDTVAEFETLISEHGIENSVERDYFPILDVVSDLPADRPLRMKEPHTLLDYILLRLDIGVE